MSDHEYQLLDKGIVQFKLGSFVDAFDAFRELSEQYPGNYKAWLGMYVCTLKEKGLRGRNGRFNRFSNNGTCSSVEKALLFTAPMAVQTQLELGTQHLDSIWKRMDALEEANNSLKELKHRKSGVEHTMLCMQTEADDIRKQIARETEKKGKKGNKKKVDKKEIFADILLGLILPLIIINLAVCVVVALLEVIGFKWKGWDSFTNYTCAVLSCLWVIAFIVFSCSNILLKNRGRNENAYPKELKERLDYLESEVEDTNSRYKDSEIKGIRDELDREIKALENRIPQLEEDDRQIQIVGQIFVDALLN